MSGGWMVKLDKVQYLEQENVTYHAAAIRATVQAIQHELLPRNTGSKNVVVNFYVSATV